jgi:signal transduction histidine kinase
MKLPDIIPDSIIPSSYWDKLIRPRPVILILLIIAGLLLQMNIHYTQDISGAYTHFFYLIIVLAGLWYPKKAIWIALLFSFLYLIMEYLPPNSLSFSSAFRALMLCLVAVTVGYITERTILLQNGLQTQNDELIKSHQALESGNKKLNMLSSVTRHDILNQVNVVQLALELAKEDEQDQRIVSYLEKGETAARAIEAQITFTRYYQDIGIQAPKWHDVEESIRSSATELRIIDIFIEILTGKLEVYADPLIQKVFYNLMENSLRHGGQITRMSFSFEKSDNEGVIIYRDDGVGIPQNDKIQIFNRGFGKNTGLGLFLSREILSITGITMQETGEPGQGVRFEIHIPPDKFRLRQEI